MTAPGGVALRPEPLFLFSPPLVPLCFLPLRRKSPPGGKRPLPSSPFVFCERAEDPPQGEKETDLPFGGRYPAAWWCWWWCSYSLGSATACCSQVGLS